MAKFVPLYEFTVALPKEVDQTNTRVEGDKTVVETTKVTKTINVPVSFKRPSRMEKEEADVERAVWETHFITKGVLPRALLLKHYANYGGILSEDEKKGYDKMQADFLLAETELRRLQVNEPENKEAIEATALRLVDLKQQILDFQQERAVFFNNTAENMARQKLIEWYVLWLSYYKPVNPDESFGEWVPLFPGKNTTEKLASFDKLAEEDSPLLTKSRALLEFVGTVLANAGGAVSKEEIAEFADTLKEA